MNSKDRKIYDPQVIKMLLYQILAYTIHARS